ncbi:hypothetical protein [Micromonospora maritima]|uniref:hypothetical protein n=1 Tax=Micromonospora maritima TaxID=986711 RepID=UPI0031B59566
MPGPPADVVRRLYATPPDRFVAARDAAVAEARQAGDPRTAREIGRLRRPTVAAWLVNLLAIRRPELVADLTQLAEALRAAQRDLRGGTLRELSAQRRAVVGALVAEVRRLAAAEPAAPPAGKLPLGEVEATLNAALSDTEVAEQVRAGRLLRASHYAGFGEVRLHQGTPHLLRRPGGEGGGEQRPAEPLGERHQQALGLGRAQRHEPDAAHRASPLGGVRDGAGLADVSPVGLRGAHGFSRRRGRAGRRRRTPRNVPGARPRRTASRAARAACAPRPVRGSSSRRRSR